MKAIKHNNAIVLMSLKWLDANMIFSVYTWGLKPFIFQLEKNKPSTYVLSLVPLHSEPIAAEKNM